jgi:integrase
MDKKSTGSAKTTRRRFGSIRKLPSGRWQAAYSAPDGSRVTAPKTFAKQGDAEAWLVDRRREIDRGLWNPDARDVARTRFDTYAQRWLTNRDLRPRTRDGYAYILQRHLLPAFGDRQLASITPQSVRDWHSTLLPDKPTMRSHCYRLLRAILNTAVTDELIPANPCRIRAAGTTQRVRKIRPATVTELVALEAAIPERLRLTVPLASWTALRFGEIIELRRHDIDLHDEVIRVRRAATTIAKHGHVIGEPKSRAGVRDVSIPPHILEAIQAHLTEHVGADRDSLLFPSKPGGTHHLSLSAMHRHWNKARTTVGREDLRFHDLRHTGAVMAAVAGASLAELMARLGHSTVGAALKYQHAAQSRDRELAALLSKLADA